MRGDGADTFTISTASDLSIALDGQGGEDTLTAASGRDNTFIIGDDGDALTTTDNTLNTTIGFSGIETFNGGDQADNFTLNADVSGGVSGNAGADTFTIAATQTGVLSGGENSDTFTITDSTASVTLAGGNADSEQDTLTLGYSDGTTITNSTITAATGLGVISYSEVERVQGVDDAGFVDMFTITTGSAATLEGRAGNDTFDVLTNAYSGSLSGGAGNDSFDINQVITGTINGDAGADTFTLDADVSGGVNGGEGNDMFIISTASALSIALDGQGGEDTLTAASGRDNTFIIGDDGDVLTTTDNTLNTTIGFSGVETFNGGDQIDVFRVINSGVTATLAGGAGNDTLEVSYDSDATWTLDSTPSVGSVDFSAIETLDAGAGSRNQVDTFTLSAAGSGVSTINAGDGADTFTISTASDLSIALDGQGGEDTLTAASGRDNTFIIGDDGDALTTTDNTLNTTIGFSGIETFNGGNQIDVFRVINSGVTATLAGGAGNDTLEVSYDSDATWTLDSAPSVGSVDFSAIETLDAGAGSRNQVDTFTLSATDSGVSTINAGDGADTFTISTASDLSIALDGQGGEDTLTAASGRDNTFIIGDDGDALTTTDNTLNTTIGFSGIETFNGGDQADNFTLNADVSGGVSGNAGADTFTITDSTASVTLAGGNADSEQDTLTLGYSDGTTITNSTITAATGLGVISYSEVEWVQGVDDAGFVDMFTITTGSAATLEGRAGNDTFNVLTNAYSGSLSGGAGNDSFDINQVITGTINGDAGADTFTLDADVSGGVNGGEDNDMFIISTTNDLSIALDGQGGNDTLTAASGRDNTFIIGDDGDALTTTDNTLNTTIGFSGIETFNGGNQIDVFRVINSGVTATLAGGAGNDTLEVSYDSDATWTLDSTPSVGSVDFSAIETLDAGAGSRNQVDTFTLSAAGSGVSTINAGDGADTFTISTASDLSIALDGQGGEDTLTAASGRDNTFIIGDDGDALTTTDNTLNTTIGFSGIETFNGGNQIDVFRVINSGVTATLAGGAGNDTLEVSYDSDATWTLDSAPSVGSVDFSAIETLDAGAGSRNQVDTFTLSATDSGVSTINAGDGADTFTISTASDLSIALDGQGGEDTLTAASGRDNTFIIGDDGDALTTTDNTLNTTIGFSGIETFNGGDQADNFTLNADVSGGVSGNAGADTFTITDSTASVTLAGGNADSEQDTLTLGYSDGTTITNSTITAATGLGVISYSEVERVQGVDDAGFVDMFTITTGSAATLEGRAGNDTFDVLTNAYSGSLSGGAGNDSFDIDQVVTGTINGDAGEDTFTLDADVSGGVNGGEDNDIFTVNTNLTGGVFGDGGDDAFTVVSGLSVDIEGGTSNEVAGDSLSLSAAVGSFTWNISTANSGNLNTTTTFSEIDSIQGADGGVDTFIFASDGLVFGGSGTHIDARSGADIVDLSTFTNVSVTPGATINGVDNAAIVRGGVLVNTLTVTGVDAATTWVIDGANSGTITEDADTIRFEAFENLVGSTQTDNFELAVGGSFTGSLDGGTGSNSITLTQAANSWVLSSLTSGRINDAFDFDGIQDFIGSGTDSLTGFNSDLTWNFDSQNMLFSSGAPGTFTTFSGFNNFQGGTGADDFNIVSALSATLNGGDGADRFEIENSAAALVINGGNGSDTLAATANFGSQSRFTVDGGVEDLVALDPDGVQVGFGVTFENIDILEGSNNNDEFTISSSIESVQAFGGDDTINLSVDLSGTTNLGAGNDTINVSASGVSAIFDGGGNNDTIVVSHAENNTWTIQSNNSQVVDGATSPGTITFNNFEFAENASSVDTVDTVTVSANFSGINTGLGDDIVSISASVTDGNAATADVILGDGADQLTVLGANASFSLDAGDGSDSIQFDYSENSLWSLANSSPFDSIQAIDNSNNNLGEVLLTNVEIFTGSDTGSEAIDLSFNIESLSTRGGNDTVNLLTGADVSTLFDTGNGADEINIATSITSDIDAGNGSDVITLTSADDITLTLLGGGSNDTLIGADRSNTWLIGSTNTLNDTVSFSGFESFTGGILQDAFVIESGSFSGTLRGIANGLNESASDSLEVLSNTSEIINWNITGNNTGTVARGGNPIFDGGFVSIEGLRGSDGTDNFVFTSNSSFIDGRLVGGGDLTNADTVDVSVFASGVVVEYTPFITDGYSSDAPDGLTNIHVDAVEQITAASDTTPGVDEANNFFQVVYADDLSWVFDGVNQGNLTFSDGSVDPAINHSVDIFNFGTAIGGSGADETSFENGASISFIGNGGSVRTDYSEFVGLVVLTIGEDIDVRDLDGEIIGNGNTLLQVGSDVEFNTDNLWQIDELNSGNFSLVDDANVSLDFSGVNQLGGGTGQDLFVFTGNGDLLNGSINGGGVSQLGQRDQILSSGVNVTTSVGQIVIPESTVDLDFGFVSLAGVTQQIAVNDNNTYNVIDARSDLIDFINIDEIQVSNTTVNTLISGRNEASYTWNLDAVNTLSDGTFTVSFTGFDSLLGSDRSDTFNVLDSAAIPQRLIGGLGADSIDVSAITSGVSVSLSGDFSATDSNARIIVDSIENIDAGGTDNRLIAANTVNAWRIDGSNSGIINSEVRFSGFDNVEGGTGDDTFTFTSDGSLSGILNGGIDVEMGAESNDFVDLSALTNSLVVSLDASVLAEVTLTNVDNVQANSAINLENLFVGGSSSNTWTISGTNSGRVSNTSDTSGTAFSGFANLQGGDLDDHFVIQQTGSLSGVITGRSSNTLDSFDATAVAVDRNLTVSLDVSDTQPASAAEDFFRVTGVELLQFNSANNNTLHADNEINRWTLGAIVNTEIFDSNAGDINSAITFTGVSNLIGGSDQDIFIFDGNDSITGSIDGGDLTSANRVDLVGLTGDVVVSLENNIDSLFVQNIQQIDSNSANNNTLIAANQQNEWFIDTQQTGRLGGDVAFSGFSTLTGGNAEDTFTVVATEDLTLTLNAGDGTDSLVAANRINEWLIGTDNTLNTSLAFGDFENFTGGNSSDTFVLQNTTVAGDIRGDAGIPIEMTSDTLVVESTADTLWTLSGVDEGTVTGLNGQFIAIENITGGAGADSFVFASDAAFISGLIDGGESALAGVDVIDSVDVSVFSNGVAVEVGSTVTAINPASALGVTTNLHVNQVEQLTAASNNSSDPNVNSETQNVLVINEINPAGATPQQLAFFSQGLNDGYVQEVENALVTSEDDLVFIANTRIDFQNFGTLQSSEGDFFSAIGPDELSGGPVTGAGRQSLDFSGVDGLVVVDVTSNIFSVNGNGSETIFRVDEADTALNGENLWTIDGNGAGLFDFSGASPSSTDFQISFDNVTGLQGGAGNDSFTFTAGGSLAGSIHGGSSGNDIVNATAIAAGNTLNFGLNALESRVTFDDVVVDIVQSRENIIDLLNVEQIIVSIDSNANFVSGNSAPLYAWLIQENATNGLFNSIRFDNQEVLFSGFSNFIGGSSSDAFTVASLDAISGYIDGGSTAIGINDSVNLTSINNDLSVSVTLNNLADVQLLNVDQINANTSTLLENTLIAAQDLNNVWNIDGTNSGELNGATFEGFANLTGGSLDDRFNFDGADRITGRIDAGIASDQNIVDALNITSLDAAVVISLDQNIDADFNVVNLSLIQGNSFANTLIASSDSENLFELNGANAGRLNNTSFAGIASLTGGALSDRFVFDGTDSLSGAINGGVNVNDTVIDTLDIENLNTDVVVSFDQLQVTNFNVSNLDSVIGNDAFTNTLIAASTDNTWMINGENSGQLNRVEFSGFENLVGNSGQDQFIFTSTGSLSGIIDGDSQGALQQDRVDVTAVMSDLSVSLSNEVDATVDIRNIEQVTANNNLVNTLFGFSSDNRWLVTGNNAGEISGEANATGFDGFANLVGNAGADTYVFSGFAELSGFVDGGDQPLGFSDAVDLSDLNSVAVNVGDPDNGFINIERFIGNNRDSVLTAGDIVNNWVIDRENGGTLNDLITFDGFTDIEGGAEADTFVVNGGSITGAVSAGLGNDSLQLTISEGVEGVISFNGQAGDDAISIVGGTDQFIATYSILGDAEASHEYRLNQDEDLGVIASNYVLNYQGSERVNDNVVAQQQVIQLSNGGVNTLAFGEGSFTVDSFTEVNFDNKDSISVLGETVDTVSLDGVLDAGDEFSVANASLIVTSDQARIDATQVRFNGNAALGSSQNTLTIDADQLSLSNISGAAFLSDIDEVNVNFASNLTALLSLSAQGNVTQSATLGASGDVILSSVTGDIILDLENNLTGEISAVAAGNVSLNNTATTSIGNISAATLVLTSTGNVNDGEQGNVVVTNAATITSTASDIVLDNTLNDFNAISINARNAQITDANDITINAVINDALGVRAMADISTSGDLSAGAIALRSDLGRVTLNHQLIAEDSVSVIGQGVELNAATTVSNNLLGDAITINGGQGNVTLASTVTAVSDGLAGAEVTITGRVVEQLAGADISGSDIAINGESQVRLSAEVISGTQLTIDAGNGGVAIADSAQIDATDLQVTTTGSLDAQNIRADSFSLTANDINQIGNLTALNSALISASGTFNADEGSVLAVTEGDLSIDVTGNATIAQATANSIVASGGSVTVNELLTASVNDVNVDLLGSFVVNGVASAANDLTVNAESGVAYSGEISSATGAISLTSGSEITSGSAGVINSAQNTSLSAVADISIASINSLSETGTVMLMTTGGGIIDVNEDVNNIAATNVIFDAATGIGVGDQIELNVQDLTADNAAGDVTLENNQQVNITHIRSNGDISFTNTDGDIVLDNFSDTSNYDASTPDARLAGGIVNANFESGDVLITATNGSVLTNSGTAALGQAANNRQPDIVGNNVGVFSPTPGTTVGQFGQPLVIYGNSSITLGIIAFEPIVPAAFFPSGGISITGESLDSFDVLQLGNNLLLEVESVEDINPAVFTEVRNYSFDNISIRLPQDQLFENPDDNEEDEESFL